MRLALPWALLPALALAADEVRGVLTQQGANWPFEPTTLTEQQQLKFVNQCYRGLGLSSCTMIGDADGWDFEQTDNFNDVGNGDPFCLDCCSNSRDSPRIDDEWSMVCPLDHDSSVNLFDYEFRFARRRTEADTVEVSCPLNRTDASSYLLGYTLYLDVTENRESGRFWLTINGCSAVAQETLDSLQEVVYERVLFTSSAPAASASASASLLCASALLAGWAALSR